MSVQLQEVRTSPPGAGAPNVEAAWRQLQPSLTAGLGKSAIAWLAFDLANAEPDPSVAMQTADALFERIARARGVKPEARRVYRQRGRDTIRFRDQIAAADRRSDPLTLAMKLRLRQAGAQLVDDRLLKAVLEANGPTRRALVALVMDGALSPSG